MPIYEYACAACGQEVEIWQKISEKPKKVCPSCGARRLERLISHTSFQLKGSGWYVTDYARKSSPDSSTSSKKTSTKESTSTTKSEKSGD